MPTGLPVTWAYPNAADNATISDGHVMMFGNLIDSSAWINLLTFSLTGELTLPALAAARASTMAG